MANHRAAVCVGSLGLVTLAWLVGCARLPLPYSPERLAQDSERIPARALIHYLGQRDANPAACDLKAETPHVSRVDADTILALVDALADDTIAAETWRHCIDAMWPGLSAELKGDLVAVMGDLFVQQLAEIDRKPKAVAHVDAVVGVLDDCPDRNGVRRVVETLAGRTRILLGDKLGPRAHAVAVRMNDALELGLDRPDSAPLTPAGIATLTDEKRLQLLAVRLRDPDLLRAVATRLIELHVRESAFPEVHQNADTLRRLLLGGGRNRIDLEQHPIVRVWVREDVLRARSIVVRQDVAGGQAMLRIGPSEPDDAADLEDSIDLKGVLLFALEHVSHPVTLCRPAGALDPDPCVDGSELEVADATGHLDHDGVLHLDGKLSMANVGSLLDAPGRFAFVLKRHGIALASINLPMRFERPESLIFAGVVGGRGPDLLVSIAPRGGRVWIHVQRREDVSGDASGKTGDGADESLVLERRDADAFHIVSLGGPGSVGLPGRVGISGAVGKPGKKAICPSSYSYAVGQGYAGPDGNVGGKGGDGGPGGRGGDGGPGGRGGDGGNVIVQIQGSIDELPDLVLTAHSIVQSVGGRAGPGGLGGPGGSGGAGGPGGEGVACTWYVQPSSVYCSDANGGATWNGHMCRPPAVLETVYLPTGERGVKGPDGPRGLDGSPGLCGIPGQVKIVVAGSDACNPNAQTCSKGH